MNTEKAMQTALEYETKIFELYRDAAQEVEDPRGRQFLEMLRDDELRHIQYLKRQRDAWKATGRLDLSSLETSLPSAQDLKGKVQEVGQKLDVNSRDRERSILEKALRAEAETSAFYEKMVKDLPEEEGQLFARFLQIEDNHLATVQFELDYLARTGYWFDFAEFDLEAI